MTSDMGSLRTILLVAMSALAFCGLTACASDEDTQLNPQPLPPQSGEPARDPETPDGDQAGKGKGGVDAAPPGADAGRSDAGERACGTDAGRD